MEWSKILNGIVDDECVMDLTSDTATHMSIITDWQVFAALKNEWQGLLRQSDADNIFLTWEWIECWRKATP